MSTARISTYSFNSQMLNSAMQLRTTLAAAQMQESSGLVSQDYGGLGSSSSTLLDLEASVGKSTAWAQSAGLANSRVQAMYSAVGTMTQVLTNLRTTISSAMNGIDTANLNAAGKSAVADLASQMNVQFDELYLFGGTATQTPPVNLSSYPTPSPPSTTTPDTSYYQGNSVLTSVRVSVQQSITYGVVASNPAFEQALRAAQIVSQVTTSPLDTTTLKAAYGLVGTAITNLANVQGSLGANSLRLEQVQSSQQASVSLSQTFISNIKDVDVAKAAAQVSQYQAQLQASFSAIAGSLKVKLSDYLG